MQNQFCIQHLYTRREANFKENKSFVGENVCVHNQLLISQEIKKNYQAKKLAPSPCHLKLA